ncbi:MAG: SMC-Scp complex subunit ScpB [Clostridia bacterium]|nr:SMC-Scp complex subunit ScpB [Clostridia bacterium]
MELNYMSGAVESILFASGEPIEKRKLAEVLEIEQERVDMIVDELRESYREENRGFDILTLDNSYQMCSSRYYGEITKKALDHRRNTPLSNAALEILSIVAYNQPVTKAYVEQIRGVDCFYGINALVEKGLIEEKGRLDAPGRPWLYGTTHDFLRCFGLQSLEQLPELPRLELPSDEVEGQQSFDDVLNAEPQETENSIDLSLE